MVASKDDEDDDENAGSMGRGGGDSVSKRHAHGQRAERIVASPSAAEACSDDDYSEDFEDNDDRAGDAANTSPSSSCV